MEEFEAWDSFQGAMESHGEPKDRQRDPKDGPQPVHWTYYLPQPPPEFNSLLTHAAWRKRDNGRRQPISCGEHRSAWELESTINTLDAAARTRFSWAFFTADAGTR